MSAGAIAGIAMMMIGQMTWFMCSHHAQKWLRENDPGFREPGFAANFFLGRFFSSFGPMSRYGELRAKRQEPTTLVVGFWGGFAFSILGVVVLLTTL